MVAKITVPFNTKRALNYNEQKVKEGRAACLYAHNFLNDAEGLNFYEKLSRFENLIALNKRAAANTVHISLNFAEGENLGREKLIEIASKYMQKIGFGEQPYLVYQHFDAGHPHIHILSTNITKGGKRISLHNIGKNESNNARKEIEIKYGLVKAEDQQNVQAEKIAPVKVQKVTYGKSCTKRAITNVLDAVLPYYKYSSLSELNAVLKLYNVFADKGEDNSRIARHRGLLYRVLDDKGTKVGVPIKASSIYSRPTLNYLQQKFKDNEHLKEKLKKALQSSIDWVLLSRHNSLSSFQEALAKEKISLIIWQNKEGFVYGLTYIHHNTKVVFNGSALGKKYSAKAILEKCNVQRPVVEVEKGKNKEVNHPEFYHIQKQHTTDQELPSPLAPLLSPIEQQELVPFQFRKQKKKKKKIFN